MMQPLTVILVLCMAYFVSATRFWCGTYITDQLDHGKYELVDRENNIINANCERRYTLHGVGRRTCDTSRGWSGTPPTCKDIDECAASPSPCHRNAICTNTEGRYTCRCPPGKFVGYGRKERKGCTKLRCSVPEVANADMVWNTKGDIVTFKCHELHDLAGRASASCRRTNNKWGWSGLPMCNKVPLCQPPVPMDNGRKVHGGPPYTMGATIRVACNADYDRRGPDTWTCSFGEQWKGQDRTWCKKMGIDLMGQNLRKTLRRVNKNMNSPPPNTNARFNPDDKRGVDIGFLLDTSSSVTTSHFNKGMSLVKMLVSELHFNKNPNANLNATGQKRVTVITFADTATCHISLKESANWTLEETEARLDRITPEGGETKLDNALDKVSEEMLINAMDVKDAVRVLFILTDGIVTEISPNTNARLFGLRDRSRANIEIYAVGIGHVHKLQKSNLAKLCSKPVNTHMFVLDNYDSIADLKNYVIDRRLDSERCGRSIDIEQTTSGESPRDAWPWNVYVNVRNGSQNMYCGGSLICKGWIVTSAQCVKSKDRTMRKEDVRVTLGKGGDDMKESVKLKRIVVNPHYYTLFPHVNDLALLELDDADIKLSDSIRTVCLLKEKTVEYTNRTPWVKNWLYTAGWGVRDDDRTIPTYTDLYHYKSATFVSNTDCTPMLNNIVTDDPNHRRSLACLPKINVDKGDNEVCYGDIGGPVVWREDPKKEAQLSAIITHNSLCDKKGKFTVVTKIHDYTKWINDVTENCNADYGKKIRPTSNV